MASSILSLSECVQSLRGQGTDMLPPCRDFTLFPTLPRELRNKIYRFAAFTPRTIHIFDYNLAINPKGPYALASMCMLVDCMDIQTIQPPILEVNKEFRAEAQKFYKKHTQLVSANYLKSKKYTCAKWINMKEDNFVFHLFPTVQSQQSNSRFPVFEAISKFTITADTLSMIKHMTIQHTYRTYCLFSYNEIDHIYKHLSKACTLQTSTHKWRGWASYCQSPSF